MTTPAERSSLVLPLRRLAPAPPKVPRLLHLDGRPSPSVSRWVEQVRDGAECALLVDADGRVAALSLGAAAMLGLDPARSTGALLRDLVRLVDFTTAGLDLADPERHLPPLRAQTTGRMARGLVRLRLPHGAVPTYDAVGVPLAGGAGALGFLSEV